MSYWALVHASFHNTDDTVRKKIEDCLRNKKWIKIQENRYHILTTSWIKHSESLTIKSFFKKAEEDFKKCARLKGVRVTLTIQIGNQDPKIIP